MLGTKRLHRTFAAFAVTLALSLGWTLLSAAPASAAGSSIWHECAELGTDASGTTGVHCIDLFVDSTNNRWWGVNSVFCQKSDRVVQCAGLKETPGVCDDQDGCHYAGQGVCGAWYGHTPCRPERIQNRSPYHYGTCGAHIWAITANTVIRLPGSNMTVPVNGAGASIATYHFLNDC